MTQEEWNDYLAEPQKHLSNKLVLSQISGISVLRYWNYQDLSNLEYKEECNNYFEEPQKNQLKTTSPHY